MTARKDSAAEPAAPDVRSLRVAVTGAGGFVGRRLCLRLEAGGADVVALTRRTHTALAGRECVVPDVTAARELDAALAGCTAVVHLAAVTHAGAGRADAGVFETVNVEGTRAVARAARRAGATRLVFLSSIKVNGEAAGPGTMHPAAFSPADEPAPVDDYGRSKLAAERLLEPYAAELRVTVLRPPLVYGPGQKGNLAHLMRVVGRGCPLPFAAIANRRSLLHVDNLADAILAALGPRKPAYACYTLADVDVSTPALVRAMAEALGTDARQFPVPVALLRAAGLLTGRRGAVDRLTGSLLVDASAARTALGWDPARTLAHGLGLAAASEARAGR